MATEGGIVGVPSGIMRGHCELEAVFGYLPAKLDFKIALRVQVMVARLLEFVQPANRPDDVGGPSGLEHLVAIVAGVEQVPSEGDLGEAVLAGVGVDLIVFDAAHLDVGTDAAKLFRVLLQTDAGVPVGDVVVEGEAQVGLEVRNGHVGAEHLRRVIRAAYAEGNVIVCIDPAHQLKGYLGPKGFPIQLDVSMELLALGQTRLVFDQRNEGRRNALVAWNEDAAIVFLLDGVVNGQPVDVEDGQVAWQLKHYVLAFVGA